jgi:hypothetical protein
LDQGPMQKNFLELCQKTLAHGPNFNDPPFKKLFGPGGIIQPNPLSCRRLL